MFKCTMGYFRKKIAFMFISRDKIQFSKRDSVDEYSVSFGYDSNCENPIRFVFK